MTNAIWYSFFLEIGSKSIAVLTVAWIVALALRRSSAAVRHLLWVAAFAALLALPVLALVLPALRLPVASSLLQTGLVFQANASSGALLAAGHAAQQTGATLSHSNACAAKLAPSVGSGMGVGSVTEPWANARRLAGDGTFSTKCKSVPDSRFRFVAQLVRDPADDRSTRIAAGQYAHGIRTVSRDCFSTGRRRGLESGAPPNCRPARTGARAPRGFRNTFVGALRF